MFSSMFMEVGLLGFFCKCDLGLVLRGNHPIRTLFTETLFGCLYAEAMLLQ